MGCGMRPRVLSGMCSVVAALAMTLSIARPVGAIEGSGPPSEDIVMVVTEGKVTLRVAAGVPPARLMAELGRVTGIEVRWLGPPPIASPGRILDDVPIAGVVERIVQKNFVLIYAGDVSDSLQAVWIASTADDAPKPAAAPSDPAPATAAVGTEFAPRHRFRVVEAYAEDQLLPVRLETLRQTAVTSRDPAARMRSLQALAMLIEEDPGALGTLQYLALNDAHPAVRTLAAALLADFGGAPHRPE
jgi:hypothetical protein